MNLLEFTSVERIYTSGTQSWEFGPVSFTIHGGEEVAITGPSGSGKSTLLHLAGGLDRISKGEILFQGSSFSQMSERAIESYRNREIGFVFQDFFLLPEFTLLENVMMPLKISGIDHRLCEEKAQEMLQEVGLFEKKENLPKELSGGERQRGAIARALVHSPKLLLADEPTGNLDEKSGRMILDLLRNLHRTRNLTLLIVTHDERIAAEMGRKIHLVDGKIYEDIKKGK